MRTRRRQNETKGEQEEEDKIERNEISANLAAKRLKRVQSREFNVVLSDEPDLKPDFWVVKYICDIY